MCCGSQPNIILRLAPFYYSTKVIFVIYNFPKLEIYTYWHPTFFSSLSLLKRAISSTIFTLLLYPPFVSVWRIFELLLFITSRVEGESFKILILFDRYLNDRSVIYLVVDFLVSHWQRQWFCLSYHPIVLFHVDRTGRSFE